MIIPFVLLINIMNILACGLANWIAFLHTAVMAVTLMLVQNPACTAISALGKEHYINELHSIVNIKFAMRSILDSTK